MAKLNEEQEMFDFEYDFSINDNRRIKIHAKEEVLYLNDGVKCTLFSREKKQKNKDMLISESKSLSIKCGSFPHEKDASLYAEKAIYSLKLFGMRYAVGIFKENDEAFIYPTGNRPSRVSISMNCYQQLNDDELFITKSFNDFKDFPIEQDKHIKIMLDLFSNTYSESLLETKFLYLMMVLEVLIDTIPDGESENNSTVIGVLKKINELLETEKSSKELNDFKSRINKLKKKSISGMLRYIIEKYEIKDIFLDFEPKKFIVECYSIRSNIVHHGGVDILKGTKLVSFNLQTIYDNLKKLIKLLLEGYINSKKTI